MPRYPANTSFTKRDDRLEEKLCGKRFHVYSFPRIFCTYVRDDFHHCYSNNIFSLIFTQKLNDWTCPCIGRGIIEKFVNQFTPWNFKRKKAERFSLRKVFEIQVERRFPRSKRKLNISWYHIVPEEWNIMGGFDTLWSVKRWVIQFVQFVV